MMEVIRFLAENENHFAGALSTLVVSIIGLCMVIYWAGYAIENIIRAWRKK